MTRPAAGNGKPNDRPTAGRLMLAVADAARAAHARGICVRPPQSNGSKRPVGTWKEAQTRRPTDDMIAGWYGRPGGYAANGGLGFICGSISDGLEMFEFEIRATRDEFVRAAHAAGLGDLVERISSGYEEETPGDGIHWFYFCSEVRGNEKLAGRPKTPAEYTDTDRRDIERHAARGRAYVPIKVLIETRGEGGYSVVAPSFGKTHPSGRPYRLARGSVATIATITPEERDALWALARTFDRTPVKPDGQGSNGPVVADRACRARPDSDVDRSGAGQRAPRPADRPGDDFSARTTWEQILEPHGWRVAERHGDEIYWTRPGKDPREGHSATTNHDGGDCLHVFSSSTDFEQDKSYTKFLTYAILNFNGDQKAAAKDLRKRGFGGQRPFPAKPGPLPDPKANGQAACNPSFDKTDMGNGKRLIFKYGNRIRFCKSFGDWLIYDGTRWAKDERIEIETLAKDIPGIILEEIPPASDDETIKPYRRWAEVSQARERQTAAIKSARSERGISIIPSELDRNPWLLNVQNGTIDLRSGEFRPHDRRDMLTKIAPVAYDPDARCPQWDAFVGRIMGGNGDLIRFIQRAAGYALTADVSEHCLFFLYGEGRNGKSTWLGVIQEILGDYATSIDPNLLMSKRQDDHPTGLTDLDGARFVPTIEVDDGKRIAEALVKKLSGGDKIRARRMRQDFYEFTPTFKIFLAANHKPIIRGMDEGIWSRIKLIPFAVTIPKAERIKNFDKILRQEESSGILNWLIAGCLDWRAGGLQEPDAVSRATDEYRAEMDSIQDWIDHRCTVGVGLSCAGSRLFRDYKQFCDEEDQRPVGSKTFYGQLTKRGYVVREERSANVRQGITLGKAGPAAEWLRNYLLDNGCYTRIGDALRGGEQHEFTKDDIFEASKFLGLESFEIQGVHGKHWRLIQDEREPGADEDEICQSSDSENLQSSIPF